MIRSFVGAVAELATLVWRGPKERTGGKWRELYGEPLPIPLATIEVHDGGRMIVHRPGEESEIRKLPGEHGRGPTLLEQGIDSALSRLFGGRK